MAKRIACHSWSALLPIPASGRDFKKFSTIVAAIVVALVLIITAVAVLWNSTSPNRPVRPIVTFAQATQGGTDPNITGTWHVAGATEMIVFNAYRIQLEKDNVTLAAVAPILSANRIISFGSVRAIVSDDDQNGLLSPGDAFMVYGMESGHEYTLSLIWDPNGEAISGKSLRT